MIIRAETPQLHLLSILDLLGITVSPLDGDLRVRIRIHEHVERAIPVEDRQEGHRRCDLPENSLNLLLDLFLCLILHDRIVGVGTGFVWTSILVVPRFFRGSRRLRGSAEDLDVELPPFHVLAGLFVGNDNHQFGDLPAAHPLVQLGHDLFDVRFDLVIGGDCDGWVS